VLSSATDSGPAESANIWRTAQVRIKRNQKLLDWSQSNQRTVDWTCKVERKMIRKRFRVIQIIPKPEKS